jgi:hypothetical protein
MESSAWTNERLDDLADSMRTGFARVDQDIRELRAETKDEFRLVRTEMREGFGALRGEIGAVRGEIGGIRGEIGDVRGEIGGVRGEIGGVRADINDLRTEFRTVMFRIGGGIIVTLIGVIAAVFVGSG